MHTVYWGHLYSWFNFVIFLFIIFFFSNPETKRKDWGKHWTTTKYNMYDSWIMMIQTWHRQQNISLYKNISKMPKLWKQMIWRRTVLNPEAVNKPGFYLDQIIHVWMVLFLVGILTSFLFCSIFSTRNIDFFFWNFPLEQKVKCVYRRKDNNNKMLFNIQCKLISYALAP